MNSYSSAAAPLSHDAWRSLDIAARRADAAAAAFRHSSVDTRCHLLELISLHLNAVQADLAATAAAERDVSADAIALEHQSTQYQLAAFRAVLRRSRRMEADSGTAPPGQHMQSIALGPVAVLHAGHAAPVYAAVGADVIAALAAGCPVLVQRHAVHPACCALLATAVAAALQAAGLPDGVYALLENSPGGADALVTHPDIKAATFSGSRAAGLQLMRRSLDRSEPIAVLLDLPCSNPIFVLPHALNARAEHLGQQLLRRFSPGAAHGVCRPAMVVAIQGDGYIDLRETIVDGLAAIPAYAQPHGELELDARRLLAQPALADQLAGPATLLVLCADAGEMLAVAALLKRQMVAGLHMDDGDTALAERLMPQLERMARHINVNGFTPMPLYNGAAAAQAVGHFLRPVFYLDVPASLLPAALQDANPPHTRRQVDGALRH